MSSVEDDIGQIDDGEALGDRSPHLFHCRRKNYHKGTHTWTVDELLQFCQSERWLTTSRWSGSETLGINMHFVGKTRFGRGDGVDRSGRSGSTPQRGWPSWRAAPMMIEKRERCVLEEE